MSGIGDDKNIQKLLEITLFYFLFTIPHKVVFKDFAYFLGTSNLKKNSLVVMTISMACTIPCQKLFFPNLICTGVVLGRSLAENHFTKREK